MSEQAIPPLQRNLAAASEEAVFYAIQFTPAEGKAQSTCSVHCGSN